MDPTNVTHFKSAKAFRSWLARHGTKADELWVGFHKIKSGNGGITYSESVDEALAHGWIDGLRKSVDDASYTIRFTPRKKGSIWSAVNLARVAKLMDTGLMTPAGEKVFNERDPAKTGLYSFERAMKSLDAAQEARFRKRESAWAFFEAQPPSYRKAAIHWVVSAKQEATRERRLDTLIEDSAGNLRLAQLIPPAAKRARFAR